MTANMALRKKYDEDLNTALIFVGIPLCAFRLEFTILPRSYTQSRLFPDHGVGIHNQYTIET